MSNDPIFNAIIKELEFARNKFPKNKHMLAALFEETGELAQALIDHSRGEVPAKNVFDEAIQVAAMAIRIAAEGSEEFPYEYSEDLSPVSVARSGIKEIPVNIWDDYWEDGHVPKGQVQKTRMYIEDYTIPIPEKEIILNRLCEYIKMHFCTKEDTFKMYVNDFGEETIDIEFLCLTHKDRERLLGFLQSHQSNLKYGSASFRFYSES